MSSCDESNISKNYIVQSPTDFDILSACTGFYTNNIYNCTGDTLTLHSTTVSANTINSTVYLSGGTNLLDIFGSMDTNTFVTGFTYDNSNNLNIQRNDGVSFGVNISEYSGLTINGVLSACTGIYTSNLYGCSPITVNDDLIILSGLTFSSITQDNGLTEILARDSGTGEVKYRDVSSIISAATSADTFVTGSTLSGNTLVLSRNDGVDLTTDLSGIAPISDLGDILFVATTGDDSTGTKGDIHKPFRNLYAAKSASTSGDTVYVFPGTWTYDNRNSAGNPYNGQVDELVNLWKDGVSYYFSPNSKVIFYNTTVTGEVIYLFSPTSVNTTCNVMGYLEFEGHSEGVNTDGGHSVYYWQSDTPTGNTGTVIFNSETKSLISYASSLLRVIPETNTTINIKSDYLLYDYIEGQSGTGAGEYVGAEDTIYNIEYTSNIRERVISGAKLGRWAISWGSEGNENFKTNIIGEKLVFTDDGYSVFRFRGNFYDTDINISIDNIYHSDVNSVYGIFYLESGALTSGATLNINSNIIDLDYNSQAYSIFNILHDGFTVNLNGDIITKTTSGIGKNIVKDINGNTININGNIRYIGSGVTTNTIFQTGGSGQINFNGTITGNYGAPLIKCYNGEVNINNSKIISDIDNSSSSLFLNGGVTEGSVKISNSYIKLNNSSSALSDGSYVNGIISNSEIINASSGDTLSNTTSFGKLMVNNSTIISNSGTTINYSGGAPVILSNTILNTDFNINNISGEVAVNTDLFT